MSLKTTDMVFASSIPPLYYTDDKDGSEKEICVNGATCKFVLLAIAFSYKNGWDINIEELVKITGLNAIGISRAIDALITNEYLCIVNTYARDENNMDCQYGINLSLLDQFIELPIRNNRKQIPKRIRKKVFERDGFRCVLCGRQVDLEIDHIVPVVRGGDNSEENLQTLCRSCNSRKGAKCQKEE